MKKLRGTYTVIVTPFSADGSTVNEEMLRWLVDFQIAEGIHGLIALASNGEFLSLSDEERHEVSRIVVDQAAGRVPVVVGIAAESTDDVICYTRDAEQVGADAAMVLTPYYCWIDEDEIFNHYRRIAEAVFKELVPMIDFLGDHLYVHGMKAGFKMLGRDLGDPRPPRLPLRKALEPALRKVITDLGLFETGLPPVRRDRAA